MRAIVLPEIPDPNVSTTVTANDLALVWVDDNIVNRTAMIVASLNSPAAGLPDLNSAVLRAGHHPFSFAVEGHARDVAGVTLEGEQGVGVGGLDIVEFDGMVASSCKETLVRRNTQTIDLGVGMLYSSGANARESLPETVRHG